MVRFVSILLGLSGLLVILPAPHAQEGTINAFAIARIKWHGSFSGWRGASWEHDFPVGERNLMRQLRKVTAIDITEDVEAVELTDPRLFNFPFAYMCEVQEYTFTAEESRGLREYLLRGGFLMVDDSWYPWGLRRFARQLKMVFPNRSLQPINATHPIFHAFYDINQLMQIPSIGGWRSGIPYCYGISDDNGRLMLLINWNTDIGDGWEWASPEAGAYHYSQAFSANAYKLGINFILYALSH